ncbi:MAG: GumC family protein [Vicinamibacterales bacterium]
MSNLVRAGDPGVVGPHIPRATDLRSHEADAQDPRRLIWILIRRRWQILAVTLLVIIPAMIATLLANPQYRAFTLIEVNPEGLSILPYKEIATPETTPNYEIYVMNQEQVLRGPGLLAQVVQRLQTDPHPEVVADEILRLGSSLSIKRPLNSGVFEVSYMALRPEAAARVANTVAEEFIKRHFQTRQKAREQARDLLKRELAELEQKVQQSEREMVKYAQDHRLRAYNSEADLDQERLMLLSRQSAEAEGEVVSAKVKYDALQQASLEAFPERLVSPVISDLVSKQLHLEHELTQLRATFGEQWPAVVQKRSEAALVQQQVAREKAAVLDQARQQALLDLRTAEGKLAIMKTSANEQERLVSQLQNASIQYNIIQRDVTTNQKLYEGLLERLSQSGVAPGMELGNIHVIEPAVADPTVASPKVLWNFLLATILGLALGVCVAFARDYWHNALSTVEDVEHLTIMPVLASVPQMRPLTLTRQSFSSTALVRSSISRALGLEQPEAGDGPLLVTAEGAEAIRTLCASILLSRSERPPRIIVVTSASPGDGKSTVARQLGLAFAESGASTLLVECDLRRPTFSRFFGIDDDGGLSLFLSGHVRNVKIWRTGNDHLHVTAAGPSVPNPVALLNSQKMRSFLNEQMQSYQFVILDAPPVLPMADAKVLGALAEGVVVVARAGRTQRQQLRRVCATLEGAGANILGAVLNGIEPEGNYNSYYQYQHTAPGATSA